MSRIDPESGGVWKDDDSPGESEADGIYIPPPQRESPVPELVQAALRGIMPLSRPLKPTEPVKFSPLHIQMLMDRAMGMRPSEIAQKYDLEPARVSVILHHPYADRIIGAIMATLADRVTDPVERMRGYTHEMIDTKLEIVRDRKTPKALRNAIASDFLDRSGYGARRQLEITTPQAPTVPIEAVSKLTDALREARADPSDYRRFLRQIGRNEGEEGQVIPPVAQDPGIDPEQTGGASPAGPHADEERKTA